MGIVYSLPLEVGPNHSECMNRPDVRDGVASLVGGAEDGILGAWCPLLVGKGCVGLQSMAECGMDKNVCPSASKILYGVK